MNQIIQELADQAGIVFWEISGDVDWRQANKETLIKFAELIVQECANRLMQDDFGSNKGIMRIAGAKLKEHFEVKE